MIAGIDEAGRGPLAGPVVAAAVILDDARPLEGLADSKRLSPARRAALYECIAASALAVGVGRASVEEIDRLNIFRATLLAMERALAALALAPLRVVVDGTHTPRCACPAEAIVKGDAKVAVISAASIIAKVERDRLCAGLHAQWPQYGFDGHKGYPTPEHLEALRQHGACPAHRRSYAPVRAVIEGA